MSGAKPLEALARLRFETVGAHPLDPRRGLNFIEQLNQTFTCLASIRAAHWIFKRQPHACPLRLHLAEAPGADIESLDGSLAAEVFAAVALTNNDKLRKDVAKVARTAAHWKYVFYCCPSRVPFDPHAAGEKTISVDETARRLKICVGSVYRLIREGTLPAVQLMPSAPWQIPLAALESEAVKTGVRNVIERRPNNFVVLQDLKTLKLPGF